MKIIFLLLFATLVSLVRSTEKSKAKCQEYNELFKKNGICNDGEIMDGVVQLTDYPFIGAIGFENHEENGNIQWSCSGALISDRFFLSVAYCERHPALTPPKFVRLGATNFSADNPNVQTYNISKIFKYSYVPPSVYDDIGLIELEKPVKFTKFVQPACLYSGKDLNKFYVAGFTHKLEEEEQRLVHGKNEIASKKDCNKIWEPNDTLKNGVDFDTQFCNIKGHFSSMINSGGVFLHKDKNLTCMQSVVGLISKGKGILAGKPGLNVKISAYIDWIESIIFA